LENYKKFDLLGAIAEILTGSVMPPYYFIIAIVQCYVWWWFLAKFRLLETRKIWAFGFTVQMIFTIIFYLAAFQYISIPLPLMERWIFSWILPFSTGLVLGLYYDRIQEYIQRKKMIVLAVTILFYLASIWENYALYGIPADGWFARAFFKLSAQGYAIAFALSILAFSQNIKLPSKISGFFSILAAYSFPIYLLDSMVMKFVILVFYKLVYPTVPLVKLAFLTAVTLAACLAITYLLQKVLPKKYSQYILGV
jgi:probable poly-beta-1,6-N-acetyl-D-glucosamine export protein